MNFIPNPKTRWTKPVIEKPDSCGSVSYGPSSSCYPSCTGYATVTGSYNTIYDSTLQSSSYVIRSGTGTYISSSKPVNETYTGWCGEQKETRRIYSDIDPYGEENWEE